jgi:hypothetical protein
MNHIIEPERLGLWTAVTFVIALLALGLSVISLARNSDLLSMAYVEGVLLNHKIDGIKSAPAQSIPEKGEQKQSNK